MTVDVSEWTWRTIPEREPLPLIPIRALVEIAQHSPLPIYVVVCGGICTGKSHVVRKHLAEHFWIADVDDYMSMLFYSDYDRSGSQFRTAMSWIDLEIQQHKRARTNIISMGTGSSFDFVKFRLNEAKRDRYSTAILHVRANLDQALLQNRERRGAGQRALAESDLELIATTIGGSDRSVERVLGECPDLLDYLCVHDNTRL